MSAPAVDLKHLQTNIRDALQELRGAREVYTHSPSPDAQRSVDLAQWRLDVLLDRLAAAIANA